MNFFDKRQALKSRLADGFDQLHPSRFPNGLAGRTLHSQLARRSLGLAPGRVRSRPY